MKKTLFLFLLLSTSIAFAQKSDSSKNTSNDPITFKDGVFTMPDEIPYGESVLVQGESTDTLISVFVECRYGSTVKKVKADIAGAKTWSVLVGPFPLRAHVIMTVITDKRIEPGQVEQLQKDLTAFLSTVEKNPPAGEKELRKMYYGWLHSKGWSHYHSPEGQPLDSAVAESLDVKMINGLNSIKKLDASDFVQKIIAKTDTSNADINHLRKFFAGGLSFEVDSVNLGEILDKDPKTIKAMTKSTLDTSIVAAALSRAKKLYATYKTIAPAFKSLLNYSKTASFSARTSAAADVSGLQAYLGIDAAFTLIDRITKSGLFINFNPYLKRIDPETDYPLIRNRRFLGKNVLRIVTPTFGFGLGTGDLKDVKPIYFIGLSARLNRIVRFGIGKTYYKSPDTEKYNWKTGVTIAINVNYLGDLLKVISSAGNSLNPK